MNFGSRFLVETPRGQYMRGLRRSHAICDGNQFDLLLEMNAVSHQMTRRAIFEWHAKPFSRPPPFPKNRLCGCAVNSIHKSRRRNMRISSIFWRDGAANTFIDM